MAETFFINSSKGPNQNTPLESVSITSRSHLDFFPWKLFLAALAIIVFGHVFSVALHEQVYGAVHKAAWVMGFFVAALAGLLYCARTLFRYRLTHEPLIPSAVGALLCGHWLALDTHHLLTKAHVSIWLVFIGGVVAVVLSAWAAHRMRHHLEMGRSLFRITAAEYLKQKSIRALVIIVSKPCISPTFALSENGFPVAVSSVKPPASTQLGGLDLGDDIAAVDRTKTGFNWNWQQLLRGLEPHQQKIQQVWLVGSEDQYLCDARRLVACYLPHLNEETLCCAPHVDLEKFDELLTCLRNIVTEKLQNGGFKISEIAVDITGGIKIASVAGAVLTLNHAVVCQYVQTEGLNTGDKPKPYIYDFRWDPSLNLQ